MRTASALVVLFLLPLLLGMTIPDNPTKLPESSSPENSIAATNPLGWEWVNKDKDAGYTWVKEVEGQSNGSFFVAGIYEGGSLNLQSGTTTTNSIQVLNHGGLDVFIGHYTYNSGNGYWSWLQTFGGESDEYLEDMIVDSNGDLILVGSFSSSSISVNANSLVNQGDRDGFSLKVNGQTGSFQWGNSLGSSGFDNITGVAETSTGNIAYCGWTNSSSLIVNGTAHNGSGIDNDIIVSWSTNSGVWDQLRRYGNTGVEEAHDCTADSNNRVIVVGEFSSNSLVLDQTTITHGGGTGSDSLVMRIATTGVEWVRKPIATANDRAWSVDIDPGGNIFVAGELFYNNSGSHEITWGSIRMTTGQNHQMIYVVKFSNVGAIGWAIKSTSNYNNYYYQSNKQQWGPSIIVPEQPTSSGNLALSFHNRGDNNVRFYGSSSSDSINTGCSGFSSVFVGITSTGQIRYNNVRNSCNSNLFDIDVIDSSSGTDYAFAAWSNFARTGESETSTDTTSIDNHWSDSPHTSMRVHSWSDSTTYPGPGSTHYVKKEIGFTNTETVIDLERINSTHTAVLIHGESQGLRFGNLTSGATNDENVWLAIFNETGVWTDLDRFSFQTEWNDDRQKQGLSMSVAPNGTIWVTVQSNGFLDVPGFTRTSGSNFWVLSWDPSTSSWSSMDQISGYWEKSYAAYFETAIDGNGDLWISGTCRYSVTIVGTSYSFGSDYRICFAQRNITNGWNNVFRTDGNYDSPSLDAMAGHPDGGVVFWSRSDRYSTPGGSTYSISGSSAGALVRLHQNGTMYLWDRPDCTSGNSCNYVQSMDVRSNGDIVIGGYFQNSVSFSGCCSVNSGGAYDGYLAMWNHSNVGWDWSIALGGTSNDYLYDVRFVGNGSIVGVGEKAGVISVGLTTLSNAGTGFVAMASDQGTWSWAQQPTGSVNVRSVVPAPNGSIEVAGEILYDNGGPRQFGLDYLTNSDGSDLFISRMSADQDADGITNNRDNCQSIYNPVQADYESDGIGDICDLDDDGDGILDQLDTCPMGSFGWTSSAFTDFDGDGCSDTIEDDDDDNDSILDIDDSCLYGALNWTSSNPTDHDGDGCKDSTEDTDDDNDLIIDSQDSCPLGITGWISSNLTDLDGDGCHDELEDNDDDNDSIDDDDDYCEKGKTGWTSSPSLDNDADGCHDAEEDDNDDNDDFPDVDDFCPNGTVDWRSGSVTDYDGDGCHDSDEDTDDDSDGIPDVDDNCPKGIDGWKTNPSIDIDSDGCHDWNEDWDDDGDGVGDLDDRCSRTPLGESANANGCAPGETPDDSTNGGGSTIVNNTYVNNTYVNNTYENDTFINNTYQNETQNEFLNNTYENNTYANNTSTIFENETFQNMTYVNETNVPNEQNDTDNQLTDLEETSEESGFTFPIIEVAVVALLAAIFLIQLSTVISRRSEDEYSSSPFEVDEKSIFEEEISEKSEEKSEEPEIESTLTATPPPDDISGTTDEHGFEWLEWPEDSGTNYYRKTDSDESWAIWSSE